MFLLVFRFFRVTREAQETVLTYGIVGAMVLRGLVIVAGRSLVSHFERFGLLFAVLLIYSAVKMRLENDEDDTDLDNNCVVRFAKSFFPVTDGYSGDREHEAMTATEHVRGWMGGERSEVGNQQKN